MSQHNKPFTVEYLVAKDVTTPRINIDDISINAVTLHYMISKCNLVDGLVASNSALAISISDLALYGGGFNPTPLWQSISVLQSSVTQLQSDIDEFYAWRSFTFFQFE